MGLLKYFLFYPEISACHPACWKCDGAGEDNCLSCHGGAQLREGKCHLPCPPGNYRTYDGHCKGKIKPMIEHLLTHY